MLDGRISSFFSHRSDVRVGIHRRLYPAGALERDGRQGVNYNKAARARESRFSSLRYESLARSFVRIRALDANDLLAR
jgi:hypothetical protein